MNYLSLTRGDKSTSGSTVEDEFERVRFVSMFVQLTFAVQTRSRKIAGMFPFWGKLIPFSSGKSSLGNTGIFDIFQCKLPEGLASEAEKVFYSLVCFATDKRIRTRFIQACVDNIANNR